MNFKNKFVLVIACVGILGTIATVFVILDINVLKIFSCGSFASEADKVSPECQKLDRVK